MAENLLSLWIPLKPKGFLLLVHPEEAGWLRRAHVSTVVLAWADVPPGNMWQCLETFWAVTLWGWGCYVHLVVDSRDGEVKF